MHTVSVIPAADGWAVTADGIENPMIYRSGGKAEAAARRLARAIARAGRRAELRILLRDGALAGQALYPPEPA